MKNIRKSSVKINLLSSSNKTNENLDKYLRYFHNDNNIWSKYILSVILIKASKSDNLISVFFYWNWRWLIRNFTITTYCYRDQQILFESEENWVKVDSHQLAENPGNLENLPNSRKLHAYYWKFWKRKIQNFKAKENFLKILRNF